MQYFLNMIKEYAKSNPNQEITENFIYSNLIRFDIPSYQKPGEYISDIHFNGWINRYRNNENIDVNFHNFQYYFLWFINGRIKGNEVKLYIPMDYEHIERGANELFDFISSTNIEHQSKIASCIRNDNVVVRVNSLEDAKAIVDFVQNNPYIKQGMINVNPFLPNYNGVGMAMDNNYSFNGVTSEIICNFINKLRENNQLELATVENLNTYVNQQKYGITDPNLRDIYELLEKTTSKNFEFEQFIEHVNNKLIDKYTSDRKRITDPSFYLEQAVIETSKKHYDFSVADSLRQALSGKPDGFTRDNRARDGVLKYVHPGNIINIMRTKLSENNVSIPRTDEELISKYVELVVPKLNLFEIIQTAYQNTLKAYNKNQADTAIRNLILNGNIEYFTNRFNDRNLLRQHVLGKDIKRIILNEIDLNNLDVNNIDEIISRFCMTINNQEMNKRY